jgi:sugar phosphate isomerase/epimerase
MGWVLWSGTVGFETPLSVRLSAAVAGRYSYVSLSPIDVHRALEKGVTADDLRRRAEDSGVRWIMDPIMNWHAVRRPSRLPHANFSTQAVLGMCEALNAVSMSAIAASTTAAAPDVMAENFAALCDAAAEIGAGVHLEFMPMSAVPDLKTAWRIVRLADRANGGLTFDTWHFFRSTPDFELLESVPGARILAVQVDDAAAEIHGTLWEDTVNRLLPGEGSFDLLRAMQVLVRIGGLNLVGPEVISAELAARPAVEAATLARRSVEALLAEAVRGASG